jgi:hypothetical protein
MPFYIIIPVGIVFLIIGVFSGLNAKDNNAG